MLPDIITSYDVFKNVIQNESTPFWIIEYSIYDSPEDKYSLLRNEILKYPQDYINRLNTGVYRIWTKTPYETDW